MGELNGLYLLLAAHLACYLAALAFGHAGAREAIREQGMPDVVRRRFRRAASCAIGTCLTGAAIVAMTPVPATPGTVILFLLFPAVLAVARVVIATRAGAW